MMMPWQKGCVAMVHLALHVGKGLLLLAIEEYRTLAVLATICKLFPYFFVEKLPTRNGQVCRMKE